MLPLVYQPFQIVCHKSFYALKPPSLHQALEFGFSSFSLLMRSVLLYYSAHLLCQASTTMQALPKGISGCFLPIPPFLGPLDPSHLIFSI